VDDDDAVHADAVELRGKACCCTVSGCMFQPHPAKPSPPPHSFKKIRSSVHLMRWTNSVEHYFGFIGSAAAPCIVLVTRSAVDGELHQAWHGAITTAEHRINFVLLRR
jgi:hypothetical protein